ncbi:aryl-alcohol dehydrogenase-like predicted oxidoreductase [Bradyrhizobium sp. F1.13.4]
MAATRRAACCGGAPQSQYGPAISDRDLPWKFAISAPPACACLRSASAANNFGQRTDLETSRKVIHRALDLGITLFDTADIYAGMGGSETVLGTVLGDRRKDIVLATKFSKPMATDGTKQGASRRYIMNAVEASLTRLKTDYIDLYQQHDYDPLTPMEETLRALDDLVRQGKVRYIGNSNFPAWRLAEAEFTARAMNVSRFVSCQDEYSLLVRDIEKDLLPAAQEYKLGLLPFFPLASGLLTGKYQRGAVAPSDTRFGKVPALRDRYVTPRNEDIVDKLAAFTKARGHSMLELAFSWLAARPQVSSVIAGATRVEQVEENVKAIAWKLGADDLAEIDKITLG